jgi:hypothetical protein
MNLETLIPVVLVALLTVVGNVFFFNYQFRKNKKKKILNQQLVELLLPLFFVLEEDALLDIELNSDPVYNYTQTDYFLEQQRRLREKVKSILKENLYLANYEFHLSCLKFLKWAYSIDEDERFHKLMTEGVDDKPFFLFKESVLKEYYKVKKKYLK